jgi:hypothetical protein
MKAKLKQTNLSQKTLGVLVSKHFWLSVAHTVGDMSKHRYKNGNNQFVAPQDDE